MYDSATGRTFSPDQQPDRCIPEFFVEAMQNNFKSEQAGHPIFDEVEKVRIIVPGSMRSEPVERVKDEHRQRWPREYEAFKKGQEVATEGTPIEEWPPISKAMAMNLKALGIRSVEDLAGITDQALQNIGMGARDLRDRANAWIKGAQDGKPLAEALAANEVLRGDLEVAKQSIEALKAAVADLQTKSQVAA